MHVTDPDLYGPKLQDAIAHAKRFRDDGKLIPPPKEPHDEKQWTAYTDAFRECLSLAEKVLNGVSIANGTESTVLPSIQAIISRSYHYFSSFLDAVIVYV